MIKEELIQLKTREKEHIALWKITKDEKETTRHIFLTHGTFSDKRVCLGIASYFTERGYTCWIMEWRNHGASSVSKIKFDFETVAMEDFPIAFDFLCHEKKIHNLYCITHSGGGTMLSMFLINFQQYIPNIKKIAFFGCQASGASNSSFNYIKLLFSKYLTALIGSSQAKWFGLPHNETYYTMKIWYDWNLKKKFFGKHNEDYEKHLPKITAPILSVYAKGDTFIAPVSGCRTYLDAFQNPKNKHLFCAKENGFREDYNHSRILKSRNAKEEIFPIVFEWMESTIS